jgi:chemotaxis methyl-accepting protein methylase
MPSWMKSKNQDLRVWCAAASTGEEPYTLSMSLGRSLQPGKRVEILATDIDTDVLEKAKRAVYRKEILQQIPPELREAVVSRGTEEIAHWVRIRREVKDRVIFAQHNLILPDPPRRDFDLIFCRNVLIYFSPATIEKVAKKLYEAAKPGALLFIGHSESLQNLKHPWTYVSPSIYRKKAGL